MYFVQYMNVGVERNLQRSIFIPHKRDMIVEEGILLQFASFLVPIGWKCGLLRQKIRRENEIWLTGREQEQIIHHLNSSFLSVSKGDIYSSTLKEQLRYEMST